MTEKMNPEIKARWVERLRSGLPQTKHRLNIVESDNTEIPAGMCCLGVLCEIAVEDGVATREVLHDVIRHDATATNYNPSKDVNIKTVNYGGSGNEWEGTYNSTSTGTLPKPVMRWAGMDDENPFVINPEGLAQTTLAELNDAGKTFDEIADIVEDQL